MKEITILSGKGGTGKTSITASFSVLAKNAVLADCDVDAPDLHMLLHPTPFETQDFFGPKIAEINKKICTKCGLCQDSCNFHAIKDFKIDLSKLGPSGDGGDGPSLEFATFHHHDSCSFCVLETHR